MREIITPEGETSKEKFISELGWGITLIARPSKVQLTYRSNSLAKPTPAFSSPDEIYALRARLSDKFLLRDRVIWLSFDGTSNLTFTFGAVHFKC